jgi:hypothetical protein
MAMTFHLGVIALPSRNDNNAVKRARDGDVLSWLEEADAREWSSMMSQRSLTLHRRWGPASNSPPLRAAVGSLPLPW